MSIKLEKTFHRVVSLQSRISVLVVILSSILVPHVSAQQPRCAGGYDAYRHCYTLHREFQSWAEASDTCRVEGSTLASIYSSSHQAEIENYLFDEGVIATDVWTSGLQPNPEIFWGNPESMWRTVSECTGECEKTGCTGAKLDMAFLLDNSGSISDADWAIGLAFVNRLIDQFQIGPDQTQIALVKFGNSAEIVFGLSAFTNKASVMIEVSATTHQQENTNTSAGIRLARTQLFQKSGGDRVDAPNVIILVTDGKSTHDSNLTIPEAKAAQDAGIQMFVIGVTPDVSIDEIRGISSEPKLENQTFALVQSFSVLQNVTMVKEFAKGICNWHHMLRVINNTALVEQGCYDDSDPTNADLEHRETGFEVSPAACISRCRDLGYVFAGTKVVSTGPVCSCGNEFGATGPTDGCTLSCGGSQADQLCGGFNKNFVYKTDGVFGGWAPGQPDNAGNPGIQYCGAIDVTNGYLYADETCSSAHPYICQLPRSACDGQSSNPSYFDSPAYAACLHANDVPLTWHSARGRCLDDGGQLLVITSSAQLQELATLLANPSDAYYYVGLYKENHFWMDNDITEFRWQNFGPSEPAFDQLDSRCVFLDPQLGYQWRVANCNDTKYFLCQRELNITTTMEPTTTEQMSTSSFPETTSVSTIPVAMVTSTITSTSASSSTVAMVTNTTTLDLPTTTAGPTESTPIQTNESTTAATITTQAPASTPAPTQVPNTPVPTPAPTATQRIVRPTAGAATVNEPFYQKYWWLILLLCLLFLLLLILLIVCLVIRKRHAVGPKIYDARPIAPAPVSTVLGDNESYDYFVDSGSQVDLVVGTSLIGVTKNQKYNCTINSATGYYADGQGYNLQK